MALKNKVAVVTGAGRGIGEAVALSLAKKGANLVLASRTEDELESVASEIRKNGRQVEAVITDVAEKEDVNHLIEKCLEIYGQIDVLVNAAGVHGPIGPTWEVDVDTWIKAIQINLIGTFLCCHSALPYMIRRKEGRIINFSGGGATSPLPQFMAYGVSKTAVVRFTETLAEEVKDFNIQVNAIAPGTVDTKLQDDVLAAGGLAGELHDRIRDMRETGKGGVSRELPAELVTFLATETKGLTGKLIAAPYDGWENWDDDKIDDLMSEPWFTLRRMDPFTLQPFVQSLKENE